MIFSTERYLAICRPLLYRNHRLHRSSLFHHLTFIILPVFLATILNIPKFFEFEFVHVNKTDAETNVTKAVLDYDLTRLRYNPDYIFYYIHLTKLLATGIIPFTFLFLLNMAIILSIRKPT